MFRRFTRDDKMLLAFATQEAADLEHSRIGNDHLILGMLCNARTPLFSVLSDAGLNLVVARDAARAYHDEHDTDDAGAAEESAADRYEQDREALRSIGIDLDKVREAVRDRFGDDLAESWAARPERGRGRDRGDCGPRGRGRGHGHGHGRGHGRGRGRRGFGPEGFGPEGFGPEGFNPEGFNPEGFGPWGPGGIGPRGFGPGGFGPGGPGFGPEGPFEPGRGRRGPRGGGMRPWFTPEAREALEAAVAIARERHDDKLKAEYLLLGILEVADDASAAVITSATRADELRAAVLASLPEAPAGV